MSEIRRVTVTSPRTQAARAAALRRRDPGTGAPIGWNIARDIDEQTELGAVYVRSLMRAQLRTAVVTGLVVAVVLAALPMLLALCPWLTRPRLGGVPLHWLLLALCVQPVWIVLAARQVRRAERIEQEFITLVERS